jgi:hypothetical protein
MPELNHPPILAASARATAGAWHQVFAPNYLRRLMSRRATAGAWHRIFGPNYLRRLMIRTATAWCQARVMAVRAGFVEYAGRLMVGASGGSYGAGYGAWPAE